MFTFGLEREIRAAVSHVGSEEKARLLIQVVEEVHRYLAGKEHQLRAVIILAFVEGNTGVWESTGSWLRKLSSEDERFADIWVELANHKNWQTRFRVACFLDEIPEYRKGEIGNKLANDVSKKVREMAEERLQSS